MESQEELLKSLFFNLKNKLIDFLTENIAEIQKQFKDYVQSSLVNKIQSCLNLITANYLQAIKEYSTFDRLMSNSTMELDVLFSMILVFSLIWSVGTNLQDYQNKINT